MYYNCTGLQTCLGRPTSELSQSRSLASGSIKRGRPLAGKARSAVCSARESGLLTSSSGCERHALPQPHLNSSYVATGSAVQLLAQGCTLQGQDRWSQTERHTQSLIIWQLECLAVGSRPLVSAHASGRRPATSFRAAFACKTPASVSGASKLRSTQRLSHCNAAGASDSHAFAARCTMRT